METQTRIIKILVLLTTSVVVAAGLSTGRAIDGSLRRAIGAMRSDGRYKIMAGFLETELITLNRKQGNREFTIYAPPDHAIARLPMYQLHRVLLRHIVGTRWLLSKGSIPTLLRGFVVKVRWSSEMGCFVVNNDVPFPTSRRLLYRDLEVGVNVYTLTTILSPLQDGYEVVVPPPPPPKYRYEVVYEEVRYENEHERGVRRSVRQISYPIY